MLYVNYTPLQKKLGPINLKYIFCFPSIPFPCSLLCSTIHNILSPEKLRDRALRKVGDKMTSIQLLFCFWYQCEERVNVDYFIPCFVGDELKQIWFRQAIWWNDAEPSTKTSVLTNQCSKLELQGEDIDSRGSLRVLTNWSK